MKKITLTLAAIAAAFTMNAQTTYFEDDFQDGEISDWTVLDEDGDGFSFTAYDPSVAGNGQEFHLSSASYDGEALTPNNYAISPAIDVTGATALQLNYLAGGQDPSFSAENYTVYVSTGNTIADFMDSSITVSFTENLGDDPAAAGEFVERNLDISSLAGENTIYVAFRHHDVSDQFILNFDDVVVNDDNLAVDNSSFEGFNHYVANNVLTLKANTTINNARLYNILGQEVISRKLDTQSADINLNALNSGVYLVQVQIEGKSKSFKIVKK